MPLKVGSDKDHDRKDAWALHTLYKPPLKTQILKR